MHKIITAAAFVLIGSIATVQTAAAFPIIIIPLPSLGGHSEITSPGEPFQPFRGAQRSQTASLDDLEDTCDELGGELMQIQDGSSLKWACVRVR